MCRLVCFLLRARFTHVASARKKTSDQYQTADHHRPSKKAGGLLGHSAVQMGGLLCAAINPRQRPGWVGNLASVIRRVGWRERLHMVRQPPLMHVFRTGGFEV